MQSAYNRIPPRTIQPAGRLTQRSLTVALILWFWLYGPAFIVSWAQSTVPTFDAGTYHLYLTPVQDIRGLDFLTHIVEIHVSHASPSHTLFTTMATYRWHNTRTEPLELPLLIRARTGAISHPAQGQLVEFALFHQDTPLALIPRDNGQYQASVYLDPGQRLTLDLRYTVQAPARYFPRVAYDFTLLQRWLNVPDSMRVSIFPDFIPQPDNVLALRPDTYALRPDEVRWLFEESLPPHIPEAHLLHRDVWMAIQDAIHQNDPLTLGEHYYALYTAMDAPASHRRLYHDQALAAFRQALEQDPGQAHYGLTRLYRTHALASVSALNVQYLDLVLHHAQMALQMLAPDAVAERQDVTRWLWRSLELRVNWAVQHEDWETVNRTLEAITVLPEQDNTSNQLVRIQRYAHTQRVIRLLEQGETDQALALAGPAILDPDFVPASHLVPLFTSWHADIRLGSEPGTFTARLQGTVDARHYDRLAPTVRALEDLLVHGETGVQGTLDLAYTNGDESSSGDPLLILDFRVTHAQDADRIADLLPYREWALVKFLLQESRLYMTQSRNPLVVEEIYEYTLDLSELYQLWDSKALALEETVVTEASAGTLSQTDLIRQMNFLNTAKDWRRLAHGTVVTVALATGHPAARANTRWVATAEQPIVQMHTITRRPRILNLALFSTLGLFLVAGISVSLSHLPGRRPRSAQPPADA